MNMALEIHGNRQLWPTPVRQSGRVEFEFAAWCREAASNLTVDIDAGEAAAFLITIRKRQRNDVWTSGFWSASKDPAEVVLVRIVELFSGDEFVVDLADLLFYFKRAVAAHEFERRQVFR